MIHELAAGLELELGPGAVRRLEEAGLIVALPSPPSAGPVVADRAVGALVGIAVGRSLSSAASRAGRRGPVSASAVRQTALTARTARSGAEAQTAEIAALAWAAGTWSAAARVSDRLAAAVSQLHRPGRAIVAAVERRRQGTPWFEAGVPSFGNAALPRAIAVGAVLADRPDRVGLAAQLDAVTTHAHATASAASAILAFVTAGLITRPEHRTVAGVAVDTLRELAAVHGAVGELASKVLGDAGGLRDRSATQVLASVGTEPTVAAALTAGIWSLVSRADPASTLSELAVCQGAGRTTVAVVGGLLGAAHGIDALPPHWTQLVDHGEPLRRAAGSPPRRSGDQADDAASIWFLLDRSGSMESIASDVVGGFDHFVAQQAATPGEARLTVVQFDGHDPHEIVVDAVAPASAPSLRGRFEPRGSTPLYDAIGLLLDRAERAGGDDADQLVVIFTDGEENASWRWDRERIFGRITALQQRGWTFVFLGANQDSYAAGHRIGLLDGNVSNYSPDAHGVSAAYAGLTRATNEWRSKDRGGRRRDAARFWGDVKEAEQP